MNEDFDILAYLMGKAAGGGGGGGGDVTVESKSISSNGTFTAPSGKAYSPVTVNVPASAVDSGTKPITSNGNNQDVVGYAAVDVAVPNSYTAGDEGKVVSNGALVAQTAHAEVTQNGTIDTTLNDSVVVNVPSSGGGTIAKATYQYTVASSAFEHSIPVGNDLDLTKVVFCHFYDAEAEYTTNGTTYEGFRLGPAGTFLSAVANNISWTFWRTNSSGATGFNNYGNSAPYGTPGYITVSSNPALTVGHTITLEVYYEV